MSFSQELFTLFKLAASSNVSNLFLKSVLEEECFAFLNSFDLVMQQKQKAASQRYPPHHSTGLIDTINRNWCGHKPYAVFEGLAFYFGVTFGYSKSSAKFQYGDCRLRVIRLAFFANSLVLQFSMTPQRKHPMIALIQQVMLVLLYMATLVVRSACQTMSGHCIMWLKTLS